MGLAIVLDTLIFIIYARFFDEKIFLKFFPSHKRIFPDVNEDNLKFENQSDFNSFFQKELILFPLNRAIYIFIFSFIKILPVGIIFVYFGNPEDTRYGIRWIEFFILEFFNLSTFCFAFYIEGHKFISKKISDLFKVDELKKFFPNLPVINNESEFNSAENYGLMINLFGLFLVLFSFVIFEKDINSFEGGIYFFLLLASGIVSVYKLILLYRKYLSETIGEILFKILEIKPNRLNQIPPTSSSLLNNVTNTYNNLSKNLFNHFNEVENWNNYELANAQFRNLGMISGLVVHDLSGPVQVMNFIAEELAENPTPEKIKKLSQILKNNSDHVLELVKSLKVYLKGDDENSECNFLEIHNNVVNIIKTEFHGVGFQNVVFKIDKRLEKLVLEGNLQYFTHVIYNLYKNSLSNLFENMIKEPIIKIDLYDSENLSIKISDNGTGLAKEDFEAMIGSSMDGEVFKKGLGLRLTYRLVKRFNHDLKLLDSSSGTSFLWILKSIS